jgi:hypothetical protein
MRRGPRTYHRSTSAKTRSRENITLTFSTDGTHDNLGLKSGPAGRTRSVVNGRWSKGGHSAMIRPGCLPFRWEKIGRGTPNLLATTPATCDTAGWEATSWQVCGHTLLALEKPVSSAMRKDKLKETYPIFAQQHKVVRRLNQILGMDSRGATFLLPRCLLPGLDLLRST